MRFQRLRLAGFKSFVEPTEFRIEPGLTGIVGPNGCGKSNLLEALRWVMGASSAKAMRGDGMDDVIFGGSDRRPSRNHAEVLLQIDNAERRAPARFNDAAVIEVVRRIDRGAGSTYRVNGVETRARDVQMLFADASTGANSPALVRQNQISELIAAKPANRRRILEEAAGVAGLHARRHEASLRLTAAEANLARLDDVGEEIEAAMGRLRREARKAETYKRLAADIRTLKAAASHLRWTQARAAALTADEALSAAQAQVVDTARTAARAAALTAGADLKPLREAEMVAAAVLQRLALERDRLAREAALAEAELARLTGEIVRSAVDAARETQDAADAAQVIARLTGERDPLAALIDAAPSHEPALQQALAAATANRAAADATVERLAAEAAGEAARRQAAADRLALAQGADRAAQARLADAHARVARLTQALNDAKREAEALSTRDDPQTATLETALNAALTRLTAARQTLTAAETVRSEAAREESVTRDAARRLDDDLRRLKSEALGLAQLAASLNAKSPYPPVLEQVSAPPGLEPAVAAAFGEALDAALDPRANAHWAGREGLDPPAWPPGVTPLQACVDAPPALAARLARIGLVDRAAGGALQAGLGPGEALVSMQGDLWRWDGYTVAADAPKPAAKRLAQRARLAEVEQALAALQPSAAQAAAAHAAATQRQRVAETALAEARRAPEPAERSVASARDAYERHRRETAQRDARAEALGETAERLSGEREAALAALADAERDRAGTQTAVDEAPTPAPAVAGSTGPSPLSQARTAAVAARDTEARARAELDGEVRARAGRLRRLEGLQRDLADWGRRADAADRRAAELAARRTRLTAALDAAREAPRSVAAAQSALSDQLAAAEARRAAAGDALAQAETARQAAEQAARLADQTSALARETRAAAEARHRAAVDRLDEAAARLQDATGLAPDVLAQQIAAAAVAIPADAGGLEAHLRALERDRDALGPVNLRAEEEAAEQAQRLYALRTERADLADAIATLRAGVAALNAEGRNRLLAAFAEITESFKALFAALFEGGQADLRLAESDDPLEAGLEIYACPPGKRLAVMSLMSGGEQALTATALIFAVFLANPAPVCVLDEVDAPLDDANVDRFCRLLDEMRRRTDTRFIVITHNPVTMSRMDRLFGVTMAERGVSQLVSVGLREAEAMVA